MLVKTTFQATLCHW